MKYLFEKNGKPIIKINLKDQVLKKKIKKTQIKCLIQESGYK